MIVLGIETSCDETAASLVEDGRRMLSNVVASQIDIHAKYGDVVSQEEVMGYLQTWGGGTEGDSGNSRNSGEL